MPTLQYRAYEVLKESLGENGAGMLIEFIHSKVDNEMEHHSRQMASKQDLTDTKLDLSKEMMKIRSDFSNEITQVRVDLSNEITQVRVDLSNEIVKVRLDLSHEMTLIRTDFSKSIYLAGLLQFLAIIGSVLAIFKFML